MGRRSFAFVVLHSTLESKTGVRDKRTIEILDELEEKDYIKSDGVHLVSELVTRAVENAKDQPDRVKRAAMVARIIQQRGRKETMFSRLISAARRLFRAAA